MTALAVALVICCAMVCACRVFAMIHEARQALRMKDRSDVNGLAQRLDDVESRDRSMRADIESLKAQSAFRSLG